MPNVEERIAFVEGRVAEQGRTMNGLRDAVTSLEGRIVALETRVEHRFGRLEHALDTRFLGIDSRLDRLSNQLFGLIIAVAVAAIGGVLGMVTALYR